MTGRIARTTARRLATVLPIILLGAAIRLLGIGNTDLWGDEAFSVMTALGPVRALVESLSTGEPHPPLYPLLLAYWLRAFGHSEVAARLPSAFVGIASVAVAAAIGARLSRSTTEWTGEVGTVVAGLLVALNPFQVWYAQEARMYAQVSFFAGLATLALLRLERQKRGVVAPYALALLGVIGTHYFGLFVPLAHGVAVLWAGRRRRDLVRRWLRGVLLAAAIYLPWLISLVRSSSTTTGRSRARLTSSRSRCRRGCASPPAGRSIGGRRLPAQSF
jgi:mannosyltransferase